MGHSSSHCHKNAGNNYFNGKKVATPTSLTDIAFCPSVVAPSIAEEYAIIDKQQWVPKAASVVYAPVVSITTM